jgi:hypothetical protein
LRSKQSGRSTALSVAISSLLSAIWHLRCNLLLRTRARVADVEIFMSPKNKAWIKLILVLSLSLVVVASAEVIDGSHNGLGGLGGRSFADPSGGFNNLNSILSSCAVGRVGAGGLGGIGGGGIAGAAANQSSIGFDNGIVQASVPEGAPGGTGGAIASAGSPGGQNGAALFGPKCLTCHSPGGQAAGIPITASKGALKIADKSMPPPGSPQATNLSDADRAAIAAFLPSLGR